MGFKPYYNWNAFNTLTVVSTGNLLKVLNLIITGMPSIPIVVISKARNVFVLNLIITGMPSILKMVRQTWLKPVEF